MTLDTFFLNLEANFSEYLELDTDQLEDIAQRCAESYLNILRQDIASLKAGTTKTRKKKTQTLLFEILKLGPEVLFLCSLTAACTVIFELGKDENFLPRLRDRFESVTYPAAFSAATASLFVGQNTTQRKRSRYSKKQHHQLATPLDSGDNENEDATPLLVKQSLAGSADQEKHQQSAAAQKSWDARSEVAIHSSVRAVAFSLGTAQLASVSNDGTVKLWEARSEVRLKTLESHVSPTFAVAFSPDGLLLASTSDNGTVKLWDARSGTAVRTLKGHSGSVRAVAFSPNGILLASVSDDKTIKLWDTRLEAVLQTLMGHSSGIAFSPDGQLLASASYDHTVKVWDVRSGAALQTLEGHLGPITAIKFSSNALLASASDDKTVKLWGARSGTALQTLEGPGSVHTVAFSPDGILASVSDDQTVKLWDTTLLEETIQTLTGHSSDISAVAFSPNGLLLASASRDSTVKVWDVWSGTALQTFESHSCPIAITFSSNGTQLASVLDNEALELRDMKQSMASACARALDNGRKTSRALETEYGI